MKVTLRSVVIGFCLIPMNSMWLALTELVWYTGEPTTLSLYANVIFLICILVAGNAGLRLYKPTWALTAAEIMVVYIMLSIATSVAGVDTLQVLIPSIAFLHRMAPLEGRYTDIVELVPQWLVVRDPQALESAYMGQDSMYRWANLRPWLGPVMWWSAFMIALCAVMAGLLLVFRKQWTEHEKLAYPIIQVPLMLGSGTGSLVRSRSFWIAFGIAASINIVNGLNVLFPLFPRIPIVQIMNLQTMFTERPWIDMGPAWVSFYPCIIGISLFMPLDLAFSAWFFFFFWKLQLVLTSYYGVQGMPGFPFTQEQAAGGYYVLAFTALWISRHHIKRMIGILLHRVEGVSRWERLEAWLALWLLLGGFGFLVAFCIAAGMSFPITIGFFFLYFLLSIAITRMRAELGPPSHDLYPVGVHRQIVNLLGPVYMREHLRPDLIMFGFLNFFNRVMRSHPMPHGMEGFRIGERLRMDDNGKLCIAMAIAVVTATLGMFWAVIWSFNRYGISAQMSVLPEGLARETWEQVNVWIQQPQRWQAGPSVAMGVGMITAAGLAVLRMNLAWWPFHPVGYAISASWTMERIWLCVFIAWLIKWLVVKYAGSKAIPPLMYFAAGLLIGDFFFGSFWYTYGIIMETDVYHFWPY